MPVEEALRHVLAAATPDRPVIDRPLLESLGAVLATDIQSQIDVPLGDNSAMDGYALRAADAAGSLPVSQRIAAGCIGTELTAGTAARIFTGAEIPPGADAVVMQENCTEVAGEVTVTGIARRIDGDPRRIKIGRQTAGVLQCLYFGLNNITEITENIHECASGLNSF